MTQWHDSMVDRPETDGAAYAAGWTVSRVLLCSVPLLPSGYSGFSPEFRTPFELRRAENA